MNMLRNITFDVCVYSNKLLKDYDQDEYRKHIGDMMYDIRSDWHILELLIEAIGGIIRHYT